MTTAEAKAGLFSAGFRPFFLLASAWAGIAVPVWLAAYVHGYTLRGPLPALLRLASPFAGAQAVLMTSLAGAAWSAAFATFAVHYGPHLIDVGQKARRVAP